MCGRLYRRPSPARPAHARGSPGRGLRGSRAGVRASGAGTLGRSRGGITGDAPKGRRRTRGPGVRLLGGKASRGVSCGLGGFLGVRARGVFGTV